MEYRINKRILAICILSAIVIFMLVIIWSFTSRTGYESNVESEKIARHIQNFISRYFETNPGDVFWKTTLNLILRKFAHFTEYMFLGIFTCALLNCVFRKCLPAFLATSVFCAAVAMTDEFRQFFISGRTPRLFDVGVDTSGAVLGIVFATIVFAVFWRIRKLEKRIRFLESGIRVR